MAIEKGIFVSRAALKLDHALNEFAIDVKGLTCADLGCNVGGFTDCMLKRGAAKVYAVDTGYGALDWTLRKDPRVVVMERTNALHVELEEKAAFVTIDVAWTRQSKILPAARKLLAPGGQVVSLIKPHYEAVAAQLKRGVLNPESFDEVIEGAKRAIAEAGFELLAMIDSPIKGRGGNRELLAHLRPTT